MWTLLVAGTSGGQEPSSVQISVKHFPVHPGAVIPGSNLFRSVQKRSATIACLLPSCSKAAPRNRAERGRESRQRAALWGKAGGMLRADGAPNANALCWSCEPVMARRCLSKKVVKVSESTECCLWTVTPCLCNYNSVQLNKQKEVSKILFEGQTN